LFSIRRNSGALPQLGITVCTFDGSALTFKTYTGNYGRGLAVYDKYVVSFSTSIYNGVPKDPNYSTILWCYDESTYSLIYSNEAIYVNGAENPCKFDATGKFLAVGAESSSRNIQIYKVN